MRTEALTIAAFRAIPGARALRYSYDWPSGGRVAWWVEEDAEGRWMLTSLYPDEAAPRALSCGTDREVAVRQLNRTIGPRCVFSREPSLTIDEWEIAPRDPEPLEVQQRH